ncbi:MAG TPA: SpoIIE family protein phosphatase [Candidatus Baltobacteraceae bacterium]|nr:SpoIIE family protein phosphatase [Candidatus Baltobacteraceae bacterium]
MRIDSHIDPATLGSGGLFGGAAALRAIETSSPEMSSRIKSYDWSKSAVGEPESWSPSLRTIVAVALASRFPVVFWWGPKFVQFYNDSYVPLIGIKHPEALGQSAFETWAEIWDVIGPQLESIYAGGPSTWNEDLMLGLKRYGFVEETYFTFSYSPVADASVDGGIGGVYCTVQETTEKVIGERRMRLLSDLAARGPVVKSAEDACALAVRTMEAYDKDVPFSMLYLCGTDGTTRLAAASFEQPAPSNGDGPWLGAERQFEKSEPLATRLIENADAAIKGLPHGPWPEPARRALTIAIPGSGPHEVAGFLVAGVSARLRFTERMADFFRLAASQIGRSIAAARAYEEARQRAEALAEIDRAKNVFFSNVSHEFRTPLTLMLGPLTDLVKSADGRSKPLLEVARRNALRLLKLVNTLLEFSRLEAGRADPAFVQVDLARLTADLCSAFRAAIEKAGLQFVVDVRLDRPVCADQAMWEKIVLNLLSNALKFTLSGEIRVSLREADGYAELRVADTGAGIPSDELPHVFERFRRVRVAHARSVEGSGIGLALTKDLVEIHGGTIDVTSRLDAGSEFRVRIPMQARPASPAGQSRPLAGTKASEVVAQYLADLDSATGAGDQNRAPAFAAARAGGRILVVDDNADLRAFVCGILQGHYVTTAVRDGAQAWRELQTNPYDLVLSDVMMPEVDGLELLARVRADEKLATVPFILLSARAGEEAAVEGLERGADDYIAKPFSADQILARVDAVMRQTRRRERAVRSELRRWFEHPGELPGETVFRAFADQLPIMAYQHDVDGALSYANKAWHETLRLPYDAPSYTLEGWKRVVHPDDLDRTLATVQAAIETRSAYEIDYRLKPSDASGEEAYRWYTARAIPQFDSNGDFQGWLGSIIDFHDSLQRERAERALAEAAAKGERDFRALADTIPVIVWTADASGWIDWYNSRWYEFTGQTPEEAAGWGWQAAHHPDDFPRVMQEWPESIATGSAFEMEFRLRRADGIFHYMLTRAIPVKDESGKIVRWYGSNIDIQPQKEAMERTRRIAETIQGVFLPDKLPHTGDLRMDAVYQAAQKNALVGGDWFHATHLPDGRYLLSIGDVTGHGLEASIIAGRLRYAISDFAVENTDPAFVLQCANRILRFEYPETFATALVGFIDPQSRTFEYSTAGHPPPLLAHPGDSSASELAFGGIPLGLQDVMDLQTHRVEIGRDDVLALYTDGLVEFSRDIAAAERTLQRAVAGAAGQTRVPSPASVVRDAVLQGALPLDDVALLIVQFSNVTEPLAFDSADLVKTWRFHSSDAYAAHLSRAELMRFIQRFGQDPDGIFAAEVILGELLANTVEHAPGLVEVRIDWTAEKPVVTVLDTGPGLKHLFARLPNEYEEKGRGLFLIDALAENLSVSPSPGYGTELRVVLPVSRGGGFNGE